MNKMIIIFIVFLISCNSDKKLLAPIPIKEQPVYNNKEVSFNPNNISSSNVVILGAPTGRQKSLCGNNVINNKENCDDGNRINGDGCSFDCMYEFPTCKWQCNSPACDVTCDPVCEPPVCQTQCEELPDVENCICDVKCEKPECEIHCFEPECEVDNCPYCTTSCLKPHCVTHCQVINPTLGSHCIAPKPECNAVCGEPLCNYRCRFTGCEEKPACELFCEEPYPICELK